jgi:DNA modification methylase
MNIELHNGDCLEVMKNMPDKSVDCIITDPPYELETHGGKGQSKFAKNRGISLLNKHIDFLSNGFDYDTVFNEFIRICKVPNFLIFCSNTQITTVMGWFEKKGLKSTLLVWHKTNACPLGNGKHISDVEFIVYVRGKGVTFNNDVPLKYKSKVFTSSICGGKERVHPTQKKVEHIQQYIELHTKENDTILDCFMGSGTTGVACKNTNRNFIGIELNENYFKIAQERLNNSQ